MQRILLVFAITVLACASTHAQAPAPGTDPQVRVLNHIQRFEPDKKIGWAFWGVSPNVLKTDPLRGFLVGGVAFRNQEKKCWIEFMGGAFVDTKGFIDPVVDVRFADNSRKHFGWTAEVLRAFRAKRTFLITTATTPLPFAKQLKLRAGVESDASFDPAGRHVGFGPRVSIVVPGTSGKLTMATSYQKGLLHQRSVWRTYFLVNW